MRNNKGFTLVELLVGIIIFTIGMLSAYLLIYSAINSSMKSRDSIIAGNIGREKIELVRNIRDTNWLRLLDWNKLESGGMSEYLTGGYYKIENDFSTDTYSNNSIKISKLSSLFNESKNYIFNPTNVTDTTRLYIDSKGRYTYDSTGGNKPTNFYAFLRVEPLKTKDNGGYEVIVDSAFKITSVILTSGKYSSEFRIPTILTNWKR